MIKLQDFARECGVTDRAIQKHLKTYAEELEGLYQRRGPNGTWLSEEACQILRSKMKQQPIVVGDAETYQKVADLGKENSDLLAELKNAYKELAAERSKVADAQKLQLEAQKAVFALEASEAERKALEASRDEYKGKAEEAAQKALEASERAQKAQDEADALRRLLEASEAREKALKERSWWQRLTRKGE